MRPVPLRPAAAPAATHQPVPPARYLTNDEAAEFLRLSPRTLEKQRVIGGGPRFRKFGRRVMYAVADLETWADAIAPQHVCIVNGVVRIDGVPTAFVLRSDRLGRLLSAWPQCRELAKGELFLLSVTNPASFDSRYFGPIAASAVIGKAQPIYLERQP